MPSGRSTVRTHAAVPHLRPAHRRLVAAGHVERAVGEHDIGFGRLQHVRGNGAGLVHEPLGGQSHRPGEHHRPSTAPRAQAVGGPLGVAQNHGDIVGGDAERVGGELRGRRLCALSEGAEAGRHPHRAVRVDPHRGRVEAGPVAGGKVVARRGRLHVVGVACADAHVGVVGVAGPNPLQGGRGHLQGPLEGLGVGSGVETAAAVHHIGRLARPQQHPPTQLHSVGARQSGHPVDDPLHHERALGDPEAAVSACRGLVGDHADRAGLHEGGSRSRR